MKSRISIVRLCYIVAMLSCSEVFAQMVVNMPQVDLILNNSFMYQQVDKNTYRRVDIQFDNTKNKIIFAIGVSDRAETLQELKGEENKIIYVKDIKPYSALGFKTFLSTNSWFNKVPNKNRAYLVKQYSSDIISLDELEFTKRRRGGFGASIERADDTITKWRINKIYFLRNVVLNLGSDKHIALFLNANRSVFSRSKLLIPLKSQTQFSFDNYIFKTSSIISSNDTLYKLNRKESAYFFKPKKFYTLKKTINNQYKLIDKFNKNVLNKLFDTIQFNNYFIIAKKNETYSIYNSWLKKKNLLNIKEVNFYRNGLEILSTDGAQYFDVNFNKIGQFPTISYSVCGTVPRKSYRLEFENKKKIPHTIKLGDNYTDIEDTLDLLGLTNTDKVSFINDALSYTWSGNDSFTNTKTVFPNLLKVKRGDKMGIVSYQIKNAKEPKNKPEKDSSGRIISDIIDIDYLGTVKVKEELPFIYDAIEIRKDGFVYFYKDNKVGIYPRHKKVQYDSIWQRTNSFYEISRNGKKGWLNINTNKEYFFNK